MKQMINITDHPFDLEQRWKNEAEAQEFVQNLSIDGFELLPCEGGKEDFFTKKSVVGVHLRYFDEWIDLWNGDFAAVVREYGSREQAEKVFPGLNRDSIIEQFSKDLQRAQELEADYVVFHVSNVTLTEFFSGKCTHSDEEVIDAAAELINLLLDGKEYQFDFLMENLWWPGLTMTKPKMTERLLRQVHYPKKGIMLDTGHLMHTNLELRSQEEGIAYILKKIEEHGELSAYIKGIHLHQSISGEYVKTMYRQKKILPQKYDERMKVCYEHVFQIDQHLPFTTREVKKIIERLKPKYLTHELTSYGKWEHEIKLLMQCNAIKGT